MSLTETKNTLMSNPMIGTLKLENESYECTITYCGNYAKDKEANAIDVNYITLRCKCLKSTILISNNRKSVFVNMSKSYFPDLYNHSDRTKLDENLKIAVDTVNELQTIMDKWF